MILIKDSKCLCIDRAYRTQKKDLCDYKFFCFGGKVRFFKIDFDRHTNHRANYYSPVGELLDFYEDDYPRDPAKKLIIPDNLDKMIEIAEKLSIGHKFLRVDLYNLTGRIYFGELTFYPASGFGAIMPDGYDYKLGKYLLLK